MLYREQDSWSKAPNVRELFESYAGTIGLDLDKFKKTWTASRPRRRVDADRQRGESLGIQLTPTLFINNQPLDPKDKKPGGHSRRDQRCAGEKTAGMTVSRFRSDHLHRCRDRFAGGAGRCNIFNRAGADRRDAGLWRIGRLFQSPRQCVRQSSRNSGRLVWSACLFQCVHLRYVRGVRLRARTHISGSSRRRDVSRVRFGCFTFRPSCCMRIAAFACSLRQPRFCWQGW